MTGDNDALLISLGVTMSRMERELAKVVGMTARSAKKAETAWKQSSNAAAASLDKLTAKQQQIMSAVDRTSKASVSGSAKASASVFEHAQKLEMTRAKYDSVYAASKRYERELFEITEAHRMGAITAAQHEAAVERLNQSYTVAAKNGSSLDPIVDATKKSGFATANLAAQLNDIGVSLAAGQSPFQVMIQQGTQISQIFAQTGGNLKQFAGLARGAILSILNPFTIATFAVIGLGGVFVKMLRDSGKESEKAKSAIEMLGSAIDEYNRATKEANSPTQDLVEKYGVLAEQARDLLRAQEELSRAKAVAVFADALKSISSEYTAAINQAQQWQKILDQGVGSGTYSFEGSEDVIRSMNAEMDQLAEKLGMTRESAQEFERVLTAIRDAATLQEQIDLARDLRTAFEEATGGVENMNTEAKNLYQSIIDAENASIDLNNEAAKIDDKFAAAANMAAQMTDRIREAAAAAASVRLDALNSLRESNINLQYKDDPVGKAKAIAGLRFDERVGDISGADPIVQMAIAEQRREMIALTETTEINRQSLENWTKAQREAGKSTRKTTDEATKRGDRWKEQQADVEREIELLVQKRAVLENINPLAEDYAYQLEYAETRQKLLNEAAQIGIDLSPDQIAAIDALSRKYATQKTELDNLVQANKDLVASANEWKNFSKGLLSQFIKDLRDGKNATDALANALSRLSDRLLDQALDMLFKNLNFGFTIGGGRSDPWSGMRGYTVGGYTGRGGKYEVAGPVHKGEYVFNNRAVRSIGVDNLEKLHKQANGFANGGYTGGPVGTGNMLGGGKGLTVNIKNYGAKDGYEPVVTEDPVAGIVEIAIAKTKEDMAKGGFDKQFSGRYGVNRPTRSR